MTTIANQIRNDKGYAYTHRANSTVIYLGTQSHTLSVVGLHYAADLDKHIPPRGTPCRRRLALESLRAAGFTASSN